MKAGWKTVKLNDVTELLADGDWIESKDQSDDGIRLIQTGNIGDGVFKDRAEKARYISESTFKRLRCTEIFEGDCLVSRLPEPVGRSCILPRIPRSITAVDCSIIRFKRATILAEYFCYYSQSRDYQRSVESKTSGTTRKRISRSHLSEIEIPVPPLAEQKRIVALLDEAFAGIDEAKAKAEANQQKATAVFESHLQSLFAIDNPDWARAKLSSLTTKIGSGATPRGGEESYKDEGVSLIRSLNVHDYGFKYEKLAFLDAVQAEELSGVTVQENDVLLNITGASVARCTIVPRGVLPARVNQHVAIIRPMPEKVCSAFLHYLLISQPYKSRLLETGEEGGSTRQAITKAQLLEFTISYPVSIETQQATAKHLDEIREQTQRLSQLHKQRLDALTALKQSILSQAFAGDLTV